MSTNSEHDHNQPRRARRRSASTDAAQPQGPRGHEAAGGPTPIEHAPMEQGGAFDHGGDDGSQAYAPALPGDATPLGPRPCDEIVEPFDDQNRRQLVLVKNGHRYVFRYERGEETKVLAGLVEMARDPKSELDWFDAAVLSHQLGQRMSEQLDRLRRA